MASTRPVAAWATAQDATPLLIRRSWGIPLPPASRAKSLPCGVWSALRRKYPGSAEIRIPGKVDPFWRCGAGVSSRPTAARAAGPVLVGDAGV